jgi:hypothetical protein
MGLTKVLHSAAEQDDGVIHTTGILRHSFTRSRLGTSCTAGDLLLHLTPVPKPARKAKAAMTQTKCAPRISAIDKLHFFVYGGAYHVFRGLS